MVVPPGPDKDDNKLSTTSVDEEGSSNKLHNDHQTEDQSDDKDKKDKGMSGNPYYKIIVFIFIKNRFESNR